METVENSKSPAYGNGKKNKRFKRNVPTHQDASGEKIHKKAPVRLEDIDPSIACPPCTCPGEIPKGSSDDRGPAPYCHLGYASSPQTLRSLLETRYDLTGPAVRLVEIVWTGREAKSKDGCPVVQSAIQRSSLEEQVCVLYRIRQGHFCQSSVVVVIIVQWEGLPHETATEVYATLAATLPSDGLPTQRQCDKNQTKTCVCQGSEETGGACFSFGCSWSMYYNGCKFGKSKQPKKFKLDEKSKTYNLAKEKQLECIMQALATDVAVLYKNLAPKAYSNQVFTQSEGWECRIGSGDERPFSGITACIDFSAHNHKDKHNLPTGVTTAVTLLKQKTCLGTDPYSDQIHSLPLYTLAPHEETYHAMKYPPEIFTDVEVPCPQPVPPHLFQRNTPNGIVFDEVGYVGYLREQENEYRGRVDHFTRSLGPPRHFLCGGVGIVPTHGSIILEHALRELHVTTPLPRPYRFHPTRIALILYQHKNLNYRNHGYKENEEKMKSRSKEETEKKGSCEKRADTEKISENNLSSYGEGLPPLEEQIEAAKLRIHQEQVTLFEIPPLNSTPSHRPADEYVTRCVDTVSNSRTLPYMFTTGAYQNISTNQSCEKCRDIHSSTAQNPHSSYNSSYSSSHCTQESLKKRTSLKQVSNPTFPPSEVVTTPSLELTVPTLKPCISQVTTPKFVGHTNPKSVNCDESNYPLDQRKSTEDIDFSSLDSSFATADSLVEPNSIDFNEKIDTNHGHPNHGGVPTRGDDIPETMARSSVP